MPMQQPSNPASALRPAPGPLASHAHFPAAVNAPGARSLMMALHASQGRHARRAKEPVIGPTAKAKEAADAAEAAAGEPQDEMAAIFTRAAEAVAKKRAEARTTRRTAATPPPRRFLFLAGSVSVPLVSHRGNSPVLGFGLRVWE